jgi:uncharacterized protein YndB with AHSA1/START domain
MKKTACLAGLGLIPLLANPALAEVRESRENAFAIESVVSTKATPAEVYTAIGNVGEWWDPEHTWSGSAKNMSMDLKAGGCFCEKLADGGSIQHGRVIYAQPGLMVRLDSPLGPLQEMPVTGVLTFTLSPEGIGTKITMTYRVSGALTMEAAKLASIVDMVMSTQLTRLKALGDGAKAGK